MKNRPVFVMFAVAAMAAAASAVQVVATSVRAVYRLAMDYLRFRAFAAAAVDVASRKATVAHLAAHTKLKAACRYRARQECRDTPTLTDSWRMCPSV